MRIFPGVCGAIVLVGTTGFVSPAFAQPTTLARNTTGGGQTAANDHDGQSFTAGAAGTNYNTIVISFTPYDRAVITGQLYLFSTPHTDTPANLPNGGQMRLALRFA